MAIIRPSKTFEGSEFKAAGGSYIKPDVRIMNFRDKENVDGTYIFILPAFKEDSAGNGIWYKAVQVRDNFGTGAFKEKFAVLPQNCPVNYFASRIKMFAPNLAKVEKIKTEDGKDRTIYPGYGRTTWRVLYNSTFYKSSDPQVYLLDLPQSGGASVIDEYVRGKQPDNSDNPLLNDPDAAYPVFIQLDLKAQGMPWKLRVQTNKAYKLPENLCDTSALYNLDEIVVYPTVDELIEKLRGMYPKDLFDKCMDGYQYTSKTVVSVVDDIPFAPAPKAEARPTVIAPRIVPPDVDDLPAPPVSSVSRASMDKAKAFLGAK